MRMEAPAPALFIEMRVAPPPVTQATLPSCVRRGASNPSASSSAAMRRRFSASSSAVGFRAASATLCGIGLLLLLRRIFTGDAFALDRRRDPQFVDRHAVGHPGDEDDRVRDILRLE